MESVLWVFTLCIMLGALVGFMAGLLGIGGGLLIVPALLYLLPSVGVDEAHLPHVAIATSLAAIILTSLSSARAHYSRGNIPFSLLKPLLPAVLLGALASGFVAQMVPADDLRRGFALFVILMAVQMAYPLKAESQRSMPANGLLFAITLVIALLAALMGIGGGVLLVPLLSFFGLQLRQAVGVSSVTGLCIALSGSLGYILAGWRVEGLPQWTLGYVFVPALLGVVMTSTLVAPLGVRAACSWPTPLLKKIFALLLAIIGLRLVLA
ncbi:sulfite exporter TauE/SafE family protein [Shewanella sedimentimangrovi]|uniref:Probable membrane transporter protein n=1 Tax=Shewanella sedimentimangrovi TaxID=2814293 RepID=A0ABX7R557_9GAMM|nr:sulfite exporter TauE/SafE family protein [Shewanella sedimentimangrovi]QSX38984.1 sulfite exporter TauE/SafE family protein [Shewanella sedimentimangrovi]